ncbi:TraR/DksA family transcriptional regulator [Streptomyces rochei]|uniref:TraR/DksA family transcriptional regulator n=1 Tax=Streptomyces rochei TaxID=1928 RepID=UPI0033A342AB
MSDDRRTDRTPAADEETRRRLTERAAALRREIAAAEAEALERHREETRRAHELLAGTEAALARLDTGTFGRCVRCGEAIGAERLHAFPHVERCLRCEAGSGTRTR